MSLEYILISVVGLYFIAGLLFTAFVIGGIKDTGYKLSTGEVILSVLLWWVFIPDVVKGLLGK